MKGVTICIDPSGYTESDMLQFNYVFEEVQGDSVSIKLNFTNPEHLSIASEPDMLVIELRDFRDDQGNLIVDEKIIRTPIPN